jgi:hypothetical protein
MQILIGSWRDDVPPPRAKNQGDVTEKGFEKGVFAGCGRIPHATTFQNSHKSLHLMDQHKYNN